MRLLVTVGLFAVTVALLLISSDAASSRNTVLQDEVTIEPLGHFGGSFASVAVPPTSRDYVYLGEGSGFTVPDTSNPGQPRRVGSLPLESYDVNDVAAGDSTAYVVKSNGLKLLDLSEPTSPALVGQIDLSGYERGVAIADSHAYVAATMRGADGWMHVVDVSEATAPDAAGSYATQGSPVEIDAIGDTVYVADDAGRLILDVTNPLSHTLLSRFEPPDTILVLEVEGTTAYLLKASGSTPYDDCRT